MVAKQARSPLAILILMSLFAGPRPHAVRAEGIVLGGRSLALHPAIHAERPAVDSPLALPDGREVVVLRTSDDRYTLVPVTPTRPEEAERQRHVDAVDFPTLATTGRHAATELAETRTITGRSVAEITELGRPGRLSTAGFLADDEDVVTVLSGDNRRVAALNLTHPQLARPLFHVWNLINRELDHDRWIMAEHRWGHAKALLYHDVAVQLEAYDTKGGQKSIFADDLAGAFHIVIQRALSPAEIAFLRERYDGLAPERWQRMIDALTCINTGEMEAYYIQWYGFYEGHTDWRADPVAIAWIFGMRSLADIEAAFPGRLDTVLTAHFQRPDARRGGS